MPNLPLLLNLIRDAHYPVDYTPYSDGNCAACGHGWPCPTMTALDEDTDTTAYEVRHGGVTIAQYATVAAATAHAEDAYHGYEDAPIDGPLICMNWRITPAGRHLTAVNVSKTDEVLLQTGWSVAPVTLPAAYTRPVLPAAAEPTDDRLTELRACLNPPRQNA